MSQHNESKDFNDTLPERYTVYDYLAFCSIIVASAIVPLIVLLKAVKLDGILLSAWKGIELNMDFFSYYKSRMLIACLVVLLIYLLVRILTRRGIELPKIYIPLFIYALMVILSVAFAEYKNVALFGFPDRYEGFYAILCYVLLAIVPFFIMTKERWLNILLLVIFSSVIIIAILGLTQFYGADFFKTPLGKKIILPKSYEYLADSLQFTFSNKRIMYTTVYNPNYLGSLSALLFPVALGLYFSWVEKGGWKFLIPLFFALTSFVLFLGGLSRAGMLGGMAAVIVLIIFLRRKIKKYWVHSVLILILLAGVYVAMDLTSGGQITREINSLLPEKLRLNIPDIPDENLVDTKIIHIELDGSSLYFETETEGLMISYTNSEQVLDVRDLDGNELALQNAFYTYIFEDTEYMDYQMNELNDGVDLYWKEQLIRIRIRDGVFYFLTEEGALENTLKISSAEIKDIRVEGKSVLLETIREKLRIVYDEGGFSYYNSQGQKLDKYFAEAVFTFKDEKYKDYSICPYKGGFYLVWHSKYLPFVIQENKLWYHVKNGVYIDKFDKPVTFGFKGRELFASGRGYIWSRSIPMLKNTLLLGNGPDTYTIYFPQNEIGNKINYLGNANSIVDKPHSWYLQMGIDTGVISLVAMLVFLAWYWLKGFAVYIKSVDGVERTLGAAILCGVTGYLIAALFNDSTVSVAPVFWTLLGVGIAILYKYAPDKSIEVLNAQDQNGIAPMD